MLKADEVSNNNNNNNNNNGSEVIKISKDVEEEIIVDIPVDALNTSNDVTNTKTNPETLTESLEATIRESTLRGKIGYFFMYLGSACSPYYGLMLGVKKFSPFEVGVIVAFMPLFTVVLLPPLALIADKYHCAVKIHLYAIIGSAIFYMIATFSTSHLIISTVMILHYACRSSIAPFMDQRVMSILPPDKKILWGGIRSYGAYGWAVGALIISGIISFSKWWCVGLAYVFGMSIAMYTIVTIIPYDNPPHAKMNYLQVLHYVVSHRRLFLFLFAICFMGMGYSLINTFLFIFLDSLDAPPILLGISVIMTVVVEIPLFQCSKYIHEHATDRQLLAFAMLAWVIRVIGYSFLHNPWLVLLLEPLHGFTFGLMWLSGMHFVRAAFPPTLSHSSVGFLSATAFGIGPFMGNIVGGSLYNALGGRWMFRVMAACMMSVGVGFVGVDIYLEKLGCGVGVVEEVVVESIPHTETTGGDGNSNN